MDRSDLRPREAEGRGRAHHFERADDHGESQAASIGLRLTSAARHLPMMPAIGATWHDITAAEQLRDLGYRAERPAALAVTAAFPAAAQWRRPVASALPA